MCASIASLSAPIKESAAPVFTLRQTIDAYLKTQERRLSAETVRVYRQSLRHLLRRFGDDAQLDQLGKSELRRWRDGLHNGELSIHTIRRIHGDAATFFNWCVSVGMLDSSPMANLKKPVAPEVGPKAISVEDFDKMLAEAGKYRGYKHTFAAAYIARNTAMLLFLASSGCRVGGLCSARLRTLQLLENSAQIDVTEKGRGGGKVRTVYLSETATLAVLEWLDHRPDTGHDFLFCSLEGRSGAGSPLKPGSVRKLFERIGRRAGVDGRINPHAFRHACAREWLRNGADLQTVSQLLGHSDISVTAKFYARWSDEELRERHSRVDWTGAD